MKSQSLNNFLTHQKTLQEFWEKHTQVYDRSLKNGYISVHGHDETINDLKRIGGIHLTTTRQTRVAWDEKKGIKRYQWKLCFACAKPAQIRHHIFWLSRGGRNNRRNIVGLCKGCHAEIHDWL